MISISCLWSAVDPQRASYLNRSPINTYASVTSTAEHFLEVNSDSGAAYCLESIESRSRRALMFGGELAQNHFSSGIKKTISHANRKSLPSLKIARLAENQTRCATDGFVVKRVVPTEKEIVTVFFFVGLAKTDYHLCFSVGARRGWAPLPIKRRYIPCGRRHYWQ